ncbi:MAG: rRNA maturation RNase YbeY [Hyphomicrobiaceae bacterium]
MPEDDRGGAAGRASPAPPDACGAGEGIEILCEAEGLCDLAGIDRLAALVAAARRAGAPGATVPDLTARSGHLTLVIGSDQESRALNRQFRGIDKPTNVLSFPADDLMPGEPGALPGLGDIFIASETVVREAAGLGIAPVDHLAHLVVHGTLHLLGYDHEEDAAAGRMEALEVAVLAGFGIADPYGDAAAGAGQTGPVGAESSETGKR